MYILRRWWDRRGLQLTAVLLTLGSAWFIRQTQGALILEIYGWASRPFQDQPTQQEQLMNAQMQELQERLVEMESQNRVLRSMLGAPAATHPQGIGAAVIGRSPDQWWQQVILGRGQQDGIQQNAVVMGTGGLVGRVIQVTPTTSRVLLLSDPASRVGVTVSRSRAMGFLRGQGNNRAVMTFFEKLPEVRPGDVISTSPYSQLFPSGLPVGRVESIDFTKSPAPEAVILLTAPINHLEWVSIYDRSQANLGTLLKPQINAASPPVTTSNSIQGNAANQTIR